MNKRNSGSDTNPLSTSSSSPQPDNKKLRQTTLPWAPKPPQPRPNDSTVSPYFASSRSPPVQDVSTAIRQGRGRGQGRGQERGQGQGRGAGEGSGEGNGGRGSPFSTSSSAFSRDNPRTLSRKNSDIPRQYFFSVPSWSRPIRKINMASTKVRHLPVMQKKACDQLYESPRVIATTAATVDSTLYIEQRGEPSHYALNPKYCPGLPPCKIIVENSDTLNCAVEMVASDQNAVGILNMANAHIQGGGWLEGTTAQEEQLCYRTTLIETLKRTYYPIPDVYPLPGDEEAEKKHKEKGFECTNEVGLVYSPRVAIFRDGTPDYKMYKLSEREPEVVSVFSVAALDLRGIIKDNATDTYINNEHREIMKDKIRLLFRVAARRKQRRLVLGALGCGVFKNPPKQIANMFLEVFQEQEFHGGWWREIKFAILSNPKKHDPNYEVFHDVLDGQEV